MHRHTDMLHGGIPSVILPSIKEDTAGICDLDLCQSGIHGTLDGCHTTQRHRSGGVTQVESRLGLIWSVQRQLKLSPATIKIFLSVPWDEWSFRACERANHSPFSLSAMITDQQAKLLVKLVNKDKMSVKTAAAKAGMSPPSARKYLRSGQLPSERDYRRTHRTRTDAFAQVWDEVVTYLQENSGLEVKALFAHLQRKYPGQFKPGQLRTLQRRVKQWRVQEGYPYENPICKS